MLKVEICAEFYGAMLRESSAECFIIDFSCVEKIPSKSVGRANGPIVILLGKMIFCMKISRGRVMNIKKIVLKLIL
jgi:hypothetical protein